MKKSMLLFSLVLLSLAMLTVGANAKDPQAPGQQQVKGQISVYDSTGQFLGYLQTLGTLNLSPHITTYIDSGAAATIFVPSLQIMVPIDLATGDISPGYLYFESDDCSGDPYVQPIYSYVLLKNGGNIYIGENVAPTLGTFHSYNQNTACHLEPMPFYLKSVPAQTFTSNLPFTIPVTLPLQLIYK